MPRLTPILEVFEMEADSPIIAIKGTITQLHKKYSGTNENGEWIIQNGEIQDEKGNKIGIAIKNQEISLAWKGREILIESHKGDKGWSGVYASDEPNKDKKSTTRKIKATKTAEISLYQEDGKPAQQEPAPQQQQAPAHKPAPTPPSRTQSQQTTTESAPLDPDIKAKEERKALREAKLGIVQIANLQIICLCAVEDYVAPAYKVKTGREMPEIEKHAWSMNAMIEACRAGHQSRMPKHGLVPVTNKPSNGDTTTTTTTTNPPPPAAETKATEQKPKLTKEPTKRPANIPADALWCEEAASYYDAKSGEYIF